MAHISTVENPWGKCFTTKRYLHAPLTENIVSMWPSTMVMIGEISGEDDPHTHYPMHHNESALPSSAVIFTLKRESDLVFNERRADDYEQIWNHAFLPYKVTEYKTRNDGVPIHALVKDLDVVKLHQEAFCDTERVSTAYIQVTVENSLGLAQNIELGVYVRTGKEFDLIGRPGADGYRREEQNKAKWLEHCAPYAQKNGYLTDGRYTLYYEQLRECRFGRQGSAEPDVVYTLTLQPYEKQTFTFALTRNAKKPISYAKAKARTASFWKKELSKAQNMPNKKDIKPLFYHFLAQELQMFAYPQGKDYVFIRQGGRQRYHWPEAKELVHALCKIGGYSDYIDKALSYYFNHLQEKDGENAGRIHYPPVPWNSRTAAALEMFASAVESDEMFYQKYVEQAMSAFRWIEKERAKSANITGAYKGIFPPGVATDNPFANAQQWMFADTAMLRGERMLLQTLKRHNSAYVGEVENAYNDYFAVMQGLLGQFAQEQKDSDKLWLPRDPKNNAETENELQKDNFTYMFPNSVLAEGLAGYNTATAEKIIRAYSDNGQSKNGLIYPVYQSTTGVGRTWYTTWAEHDRFIYYKACKNQAEMKKLLDSLLKYNVTSEYYQGERYDDHDGYTVPWMPNASANGRVLQMLFDVYGVQKTK